MIVLTIYQVKVTAIEISLFPLSSLELFGEYEVMNSAVCWCLVGVLSKLFVLFRFIVLLRNI